MQNKKKKKKISNNTIAIIGSIIILIGGFLLSYNYIESKKVVAHDYVANVFYKEKNNDVKEEKEEAKEETNETTEEPDVVTNEYIGYLNIPKINLTKGFLDSRSEDNNVEKNIMVVNGSNYPDVKKGNFILAGHSGTGWKAFFNDLYKLDTNDVIYITYKNKKYEYHITNIYKQPKTGTLAIYRDYEKTTLTLITCTNGESTSQTLYIAELTKTTEE